MYGIALEELGRDKVSSVVGQEPGYLADYELDKKHRPKNPMISLGAIAVASLIRPKEELAERFAFVMGVWEKLTASKPHFDNYRFLKDSETNDRKYSLAYLAKDHGGFLHVFSFMFFYCSFESLELFFSYFFILDIYFFFLTFFLFISFMFCCWKQDLIETSLILQKT